MGGSTKKARGRVKQAVGAISGDKKLQREGMRDERVGSLEDTVAVKGTFWSRFARSGPRPGAG